MSASTEPAYEAWVKGYKDPSKGGDLILGDCPFSHRALLTLHEKHVPFTQHYVDLKNKPDWIFQVNEKGSVPVLKDLRSGNWLASSEDIVDTLEDQYPEPALGKAASVPEAGSKVFPAFVQFLRSSDSEAADKQSALDTQLSDLNGHLESNGPFLKGDNISAGDMALAPKLYHLKIALKELKGWDKLGNYPDVQQYLDRMQQRDSWKATYYAPEIVVAGWKGH
jgi:glutathione S-transferase